ncbi:MAG: class III signal peptide-containing protein [Planctomycetaceae bacterium]
MLRKLNRILRNKKGQGLVEYGILVGGVALVCLAAVAILGHKTNDLVATVAGALPVLTTTTTLRS